MVDDYGTEMVLTSEGLFPATEVKWVKAYMPGAKGGNWRHKSHDTQGAIRAFHENDANCNTCKHLQRVKHEKCKFGFLEGRCIAHGMSMRFHPDDPMLMPCYEPRW